MNLDLEKLNEIYGTPMVCPSCGCELKTTDMDVYCPNENCTARMLNIVSQFVKKLDIKNVSVASLEAFGIDSFEKLLSFKANPKYKNQTKFKKELEDKMFRATESELFCALNFSGLSSILLNKLIDFYGFETLKTANDQDNPVSYLSENGLPAGIGLITLEKFCNNLKKNLDIVQMIQMDSRYNPIEKKTSDIPKTDKSICFTGSLNTMGRTEASKLAIAAGYEVKSSVSKGLTYLVTNDVNSGSTKAKKALSYGTKIINEEEFLKLVNKKENNELFELL